MTQNNLVQDANLAQPAGDQARQSGASAALGLAEHGQVDAHTIRAREQERASLQADIESFLATGGKVTRVEPLLRADLPCKPQNNYGKGSL